MKINSEITSEEVIVVGPYKNTTLLKLNQAISMAEAEGMDLVEVQPGSIPICKIMDYKKFLYNQKPANKTKPIKEVGIGPNISQHDFDHKYRTASTMLSKGFKVKVVMFFKGRTIVHKDLGTETFNKFVSKLQEEGLCKLEKPAKFEGKRLIGFLHNTK